MSFAVPRGAAYLKCPGVWQETKDNQLPVVPRKDPFYIGLPGDCITRGVESSGA
jgi:hypothetical protein